MRTVTLTEREHYRLINGGPAFELTWDGLVFTVNTVQSRTVVEIRFNGVMIFRALPPDQSGTKNEARRLADELRQAVGLASAAR
jgi:hypothetical protein